ncbi:pyridoxine/pyridoxamine 5'-phosphate oxidase [Homoserinimonas sp. A520]
MTQKNVRTWLRELPVFPDAVAPFDTATLPQDPTTLFLDWLENAAAAGQLAPHAACLSTSRAAAVPSGRFLILKDVDDRGWQFASHRTSPKGLDLRENPVASLTFFWPATARQVRVSGAVSELPAEESAQDFLARPIGSRAATLVGRQSSPLADPDAYGAALDAALRELSGNPETVDSDWTLYALNPSRVEFWQASAGRDHTRVLFERRDTTWEKTLLWP